MSDPYLYHPVVLNPGLRLQTLSTALQTPFFFGGSQIPEGLRLPKSSYQGSGLKSKIHKGVRSLTRDGEDFMTHAGDKVFHREGKFVKLPGRKPYKRISKIIKKKL